MDDSAAQSGRGIHVVHTGQRITDDCEVVCERELHPLFCRAAVLQQSKASVPLVRVAAGQVEAEGHVLDELFGPAVVLQPHSLRAVQQKDQVHRPSDTGGHSRLWRRHTQNQTMLRPKQPKKHQKHSNAAKIKKQHQQETTSLRLLCSFIALR